MKTIHMIKQRSREGMLQKELSNMGPGYNL